MKMVKSLLLGAAVGMIAVSSAQVADLPVIAKSAQPVRTAEIVWFIDSTSGRSTAGLMRAHVDVSLLSATKTVISPSIFAGVQSYSPKHSWADMPRRIDRAHSPAPRTKIGRGVATRMLA